MRCTYCGLCTHTLANCPKTWSGSSSRFHMRCTYCGSRKHKLNACPSTVSGPANRRWRPQDVKDDYVLD